MEDNVSMSLFEKIVYLILVYFVAVIGIYLYQAITSDDINNAIGFIFDSAWLSPTYSFNFLFEFLSRDNFFNNNTIPNKKWLTIAFLALIYSPIGLLIALPIDSLINKFIIKRDSFEPIFSWLFTLPLLGGVFYLSVMVLAYFPFSVVGNLINM